MKFLIRKSLLLGLWLIWLAGCAPAARSSIAPTAVPTPLPLPTATLSLVPLTPTLLPSPTSPAATAAAPTTASATNSVTATPQEIGPGHYPPGVNPLTGLQVADLALLERRPLLVKVENLPREHRPQWGLSQADLVFEYYTEFGTTRFAALFYGNDAAQVGPIRSARFFDINLIRMYKAIFAFGSAYEGVYNRLMSSEFANRLVLEQNGTCPPMCRFEPDGLNLLVTRTLDLTQYANQKGIPNTRQNLEGMSFIADNSHKGMPVSQLFTRFSGAIYNRWDFDPASGQYLRFSDVKDDLDRINEVYAPLTDRLTGQPVSVENVVVLLLPYQYLVKTATTEVLDMAFTGKGTAYAFRDGQVNALQWQRPSVDAVVSLVKQDGSPYPFKPGRTWFEVMGVSTQLIQKDNAWRFNFSIP
jgi:hypothetical protein